MMKRNIHLFIAGLILLSPLAYAKTGLLFNINESGTPAAIDLILCLNAKGPISCQHYHVDAMNLRISTTVNHHYPEAGIKVLTPNYKVTGCTPYANGYCLFATSNTTPAAIFLSSSVPKQNQTITFTSTPPSNPTVGGTYNVITTASSGLTVSITIDSSSSSICSISGNTVTFNATGLCILNANQAGNANYNPAPQLNQSLTVGPSTLISGGTNFTNSNSPLLVQSIDNGKSWTVVSSIIPSLTSSGALYSSTCTNSGQTAPPQTVPICIAAGANFQNGGPLLTLSTTGGANWILPVIPGLTDMGAFYSNSCTDTGNNAVCVVTGENFQTGSPLIIMTTDGGGNWAIPTIPGMTNNGFFTSNSCSGAGATSICLAVGADLSTGKPLLALTNNGGSSWIVPTISGLPDIGSFSSASCTGAGTNAVCVAAGADMVTGAPLLVSTMDGGNNWTINHIPNLTTEGSFFSTSCIGSTCMAVGTDLATGAPLLVLTNNKTVNWTIPTISGLSNFGSLYAVNCTGTTQVTCLAVGESLDTGAPLLVLTTNNGATWSLPANTITGLTSFGALYATQCLQSNGRVTCTASGTDLNSGAPLLLITQDTGATWNVASTSIVGLTPFGAFYGATQSKANQNIKKTIRSE